MAKTTTPARKNPATTGGRSGAVSIQRLVASQNRWREHYNPLRSLVMARVVTMLEEGERGEFANLQWLYRFIEKRYPTLRGLIKRWRGAMAKLDWDIKIKSELPEGATESMAERQRQTLRARYEAVDNLREAINFLVLAEFRGFAHLNKHRSGGGRMDGAVTHLEIIDQWQWVRNPATGDYYYNQDAQQVSWTYLASQPPIRPGHPDFIIAEEDMPVNEIAAVLFLRGNLCEKDWDGFVELFGIERPNVIGPPNVPADKEDDYLAAAERIANGEGGYLPNGSEVVYPGQRGSGGAPFKERLDYLQEQLVLAGTGGLLTMLAKNTGLGKGSTDAHDDGFDDLAALKARDLSELFQKQFDAEVLATEHPAEPACVYFELCAPDKEDVGELVQNVATLKSAGFTADAGELSEKTGLKLEEAETPVPQSPPPNPPAAVGGKKDDDADEPDERLQNRAATETAAAAALAEDLTPVLALLEVIADQPALITRFLNSRPQIQRAVVNSDALRRYLTPELEKQFIHGAKS